MFLERIDRETPKKLDLHLIVDNYRTHKHQVVQTWLQAHPRFHIHFVPTSCSWLNLVERFFSEITNKRIRRGIFRSLRELITSINGYIRHRNGHPMPFTWTASVKHILKKVRCGKEALETLH